MQSILFWAATTAYALSTALFFIDLAFRRAWGTRLGLLLAGLGLAPHAAALGLRWAEVGHGPYSTRYEVFSAGALLMVAIFAGAGLKSRGFRSLGAFVMPVAFLLMGLAVSTFEVKNEVPIIFKSYWLWLHVGFANAFSACTFLASGASAAYLFKRRRPEALARLPSPEVLEAWSHQLLLVAFLFLGVMIAAGSLWAKQSWGRYWAWDPIETSSLATWLGFGIILHFRVLQHWSGPRMAALTFVALAMAVVTLYVVALVAPTIHNSYLVGAS